MGRNKDGTIPPMENDNLTYFDEKAYAFNEALLLFSKLDTAEALLPDVAYKTDSDSRLSNIPILESKVRDMLKSLDTSKASGPEGMSAKMLKENAASITPSLTTLFQRSFEKGKIPKLWKQADVLSLH